jgi:hypothetical protein
VVEHVIPLANRLVEGEWFTSRASAAGILPDIYTHASDDQKATLRSYVRIFLSHALYLHVCVTSADTYQSLVSQSICQAGQRQNSFGS